jgi:hypothetical protein
MTQPRRRLNKTQIEINTEPTHERLVKLCKFFHVTQDTLVNDSLTSHMISKGVTYEEILAQELAVLTGTKK